MTTPPIDARTWQQVWSCVLAAADEISRQRFFDAPLVESGPEYGFNIGTAFHSAIQRALIASGIGQHARQPGNHDLELFGYRGEIKTAVGRDVITNKSYTQLAEGKRLVIVVNYRVAGGRLVPYLLRWGMVGPGDYVAGGSSSVQMAKLSEAALARLAAPLDFDINDFPARFWPGAGDAIRARLGEPETVRDLRRALMRAGIDSSVKRLLNPDASGPAQIARAAGWLSYGKRMPQLSRAA